MSHRLARSIFHVMAVHRAGLEKRQRVLARVVDIGVDLFAMAASCAYAQELERAGNGGGQDGAGSPRQLADLFCREALRRVRRNFKDLWYNDDRPSYRVARDMLAGHGEWLEQGVLKP
jgi:hypothetical protein